MSDLPASEAPLATADDSHAVHQRERNRKLKWAILTSLISRPLALFIPLIIVPVFLRELGTERYGLFEAVGSLAAWFGLTNFGLGLGLMTRLMDCYVSGHREMARRYVSTLVVALGAIFCAGLAIVTIVTFSFDWRGPFAVEELLGLRSMQWAIWLACVIPMLGVTLSMAPAIYSAYQEIHRQNIWETCSKVATITACLLVPFLDWGIIGALLALSGVPVLISALNHLHLWILAKPWLRPSLRLFSPELLRQLLADGFLLFLLQSSVALMYQADRLIIGVLRTPEEVAQYSVTNRLFMAAYGAYILFVMPLWPAYGEAIRRGDLAWCRSRLRLSSVMGLVVMGCAGAALLIGGEWFLPLITGKRDLALPWIVIVGMTLGLSLRVWSDSHSILLNSARVLTPQIMLVGANALLTLAINLFATWRFGIVGTAWSFPVAAILTTVIGYPMLVQRYVFRRAGTASAG